MSQKIAVILFPGTNCELETIRACKRSNMSPEIFRWNDDKSKLKKYNGFIIPGGFSYEDRGRSGIIASKDNIMETIKKEASKGKPVLGICNGAQILVESGLIPGLSVNDLEMGLGYNERIRDGKILGTGFYNDWVYIKSDSTPGRSAYNWFGQNIIMKIPIAHGEGRFVTKDKKILDTLIASEQTLFRYCDEHGEYKNEFPVNPNGSLFNLAGVCNREGNVLSLMPHPERTINGQAIFDSMADYIKGKFKTRIPHGIKTANYKPIKDNNIPQHNKQTADIAIKVDLIITDNEEWTIENTMKKSGFKDLKLKRNTYFEIKVNRSGKKPDLKKIAEKIIESGELINLNKEIPTIIIEDKTYKFDKESGLIETKSSKPAQTRRTFFVTDYDNYAGKSVFNKIEPHFRHHEITEVKKGILWSIQTKRKDQIQKLIDTHIFHNPHSMKLVEM